MRREDDHGLRFPELTRKRFDWQKWLGIAAIAIPLAMGAFYVYRNIRAEMTPGEGDLIVNVNTATQDELETIPGIGPALSRQIIAGRPWQRVEDLERIQGIGPYTLNRLLMYCSASDCASALHSRHPPLPRNDHMLDIADARLWPLAAQHLEVAETE